MLSPHNEDPKRKEELARRKEDPTAYCICNGETQMTKPKQTSKGSGKDATK